MSEHTTFYLSSRVFLKKIAEYNRYELDGNFSTYRLIEETGNIIAVDPEGGPMISVGDHINNFLVSEITLEDNTIILTLRNI